MAKDVEQKHLDYYKITFSTRAGRYVLNDLMTEHVLSPKFTGNPYIDSYKQGKQDLVLEILTVISENKEKLAEKIKSLMKGDQ